MEGGTVIEHISTIVLNQYHIWRATLRVWLRSKNIPSVVKEKKLILSNFIKTTKGATHTSDMSVFSPF